MKLVVSQIKWIMRVAGLLTCTMAYMAFSPQDAMRSTFGAAFLDHQAGIAIVTDAVMVLLFAAYLLGIRRIAANPDP